MRGDWKEVARLRFHGDRFRDHALDLSAVTELRRFQKIVAETAKALWRAANPDRERLPARFEERTRLCLRRIEDGSASVPLEVYLEPPDQLELFDSEPQEVNNAIALAYDVFASSADDRELPPTLPKELIPYYAELGDTLGDGEELEIQPVGQQRAVRVDRVSRARLAAHSERPHQSIAEFTGECLEADVRHRRFQVHPTNAYFDSWMPRILSLRNSWSRKP